MCGVGGWGVDVWGVSKQLSVCWEGKVCGGY